MIPLEKRILTAEFGKLLSRLHSTVTEEEIAQLVAGGYGSLERINAVREESQRLVAIALIGATLSEADIALLNREAHKSRPHYDIGERRWTYLVEEGEAIDLWFPMFGEYVGSGRMKECEYEKCRRVYVYHPQLTGKRVPNYCSKSCYNRAVTIPYIMAKRAEERRQRKKSQ